MKGYAVRLVLTLAAWLILFGSFTFIVDPYHVNAWSEIPGVNERRTRAHADGYRVAVGHGLVETQAGTLLFGSSRSHDGFPDNIPDWPGGFENMAMGGTNAFELANAAVLAAENNHLDCAIIGLDLREFGDYPRADATYWLTPLAGGSQLQSHIQTSLSLDAFARALQTVIDNATGGSDVDWETAYAPENSRERFDTELAKRYRSYLGFVYDPERSDFVFRGIDALLARGVQVRIFIHPIHSRIEEARWRAGIDPIDLQIRRDLVRLAAARNPAPSRAPCFPGEPLEVWDFAGFSEVSQSAPPSHSGDVLNPWYYEPSHYRPALGLAILDRMLGEDRRPPVSPEQFGVRLTADNLDQHWADVTARRADWLENDEWAAWLTEQYDAMEANPPPIEERPHVFLNRDDFNSLERRVSRIEQREQGMGER
ncbi:hypothetical protein [Hyphobacterium indicum]|uniref:hypothetical protein n=1 Tax=Hyphobacterium indicum TaxID=2162714 RepID=UPI000D6555FA|nr:hypothetical protein [Hyphobacterium indicum]